MTETEASVIAEDAVPFESPSSPVVPREEGEDREVLVLEAEATTAEGRPVAVLVTEVVAAEVKMLTAARLDDRSLEEEAPSVVGNQDHSVGDLAPAVEESIPETGSLEPTLEATDPTPEAGVKSISAASSPVKEGSKKGNSEPRGRVRTRGGKVPRGISSAAKKRKKKTAEVSPLGAPSE